MDRRTMILAGVMSGVSQAVGSMLHAQPAQGGTAAARAADAERAFAAAMAQRDAAAFASFVSEEALFVGGGDTPRVLRGRAAIVQGWAPYFEGAAAPFSWEPDFADAIDSGGLAFTSGPVRDPQGEIVGRFNSVWRLEADGRWRVLFDRGSPVCR